MAIPMKQVRMPPVRKLIFLGHRFEKSFAGETTFAPMLTFNVASRIAMSEIIDTNHDTTRHLSALKAAGIKTVIRYLSPINPHGEKCVKPAEAHAIAAAGLRLALVCEGWGDFAHGAISGGAGERDGEWCAKYAASVGAPAGAWRPGSLRHCRPA